MTIPSDYLSCRRVALEAISKITHLGSEYEKIIRAVYCGTLKRGDTAVDVGARRGDHTFPLARIVGRSGRIYAFEPFPGDIDKLFNSAISHGIDKQIIFSPLALSDASGHAEFTCCDGLPGHSGLKEKKSYPYECTIRKTSVETARLDDILKGNNVSFIKIDVEGAEFSVLRGSSNTLKRHRPLVIFENSFTNAAALYEYSKEDFFSFFSIHGYVLYDILGMPINESHWGHRLLTWNFIAIPSDNPILLSNTLLSAKSAAIALFPDLTDFFVNQCVFCPPHPDNISS